MEATPIKTGSLVERESSAGVESEKSGEKGGDMKKVPSIREVPLPYYDDAEALSKENAAPIATAEEIVTHVIHVDDDPTLNPWTFRMFFIGEPFLCGLPFCDKLACPLTRSQVLDCPHSERSCKKSCTSSPRLFSSRSCS
jgi:hypothetical protein